MRVQVPSATPKGNFMNNVLPPLSTDEFEALKADIKRNGILHPVIVDESGHVIDGNHRLMIDPDAPKQVVTGLTEAEKLAYAYRMNFVRRNLSPSQKTETRKKMKQVAKGLKEEGRTQEEIGELLGITQQAISKWKLFGDATNTTNGNSCMPDSRVKVPKDHHSTIAERAKEGEAQEQIAADYGVTRQAIGKIVTKQEKEESKKDEELPNIELPKVGNWEKLGSHLLYCGDTSKPEFWKGLPQAMLAFADPPYNADVAEWDSNFEWKHDWLIQKASVVCVTPGLESIQSFFRDDTKMPYVWSMAVWIKNGMTRGKLGFGNWIYTAVFSNDSVYHQAQDHISVTIKTSETDNTEHKGRKPYEMLVRLIELFTEPGDIIIDPFLGSGTTLFAAEETGRVCIGGEINPLFCQQIAARYNENRV